MSIRGSQYVTDETKAKYVVGPAREAKCRGWSCRHPAKFEVKNPRYDGKGDTIDVCGVHRNEALRNWQATENNIVAARLRKERDLAVSRALNLANLLTEHLGIPITTDTGYSASGSELHISIETARMLFDRDARIVYGLDA